MEGQRYSSRLRTNSTIKERKTMCACITKEEEGENQSGKCGTHKKSAGIKLSNYMREGEGRTPWKLCV